MAKTHQIKIDTNQATANVDKLSKSLDNSSKSLVNAQEQSEKFAKSTDNIQKVSAGMQGSLQAVSGAMTLFGSDSEAVTQVMTKFSSVMASTNGIKAMGEGVKSLGSSMSSAAKEGKLLNNVFKASAIGLVVASVGYLVSHFDELRERFNWIDVAATKTEEVFNGLKGVFTNIVPVMKDLGKTIGTALISPIRTIVDGYQGIGKLLGTVLKGDFKNIPNIAKEIGKDIKDNFTDVGAAAKSLGNTVSNAYNEGLKEGDKSEGGKSWVEKKREELERLKNIWADEAEIEKMVTEGQTDRMKTLDELYGHITTELELQIQKEKELKQIETDRIQNYIKLNEESNKLLNTLKESMEEDEDEEVEDIDAKISKVSKFRTEWKKAGYEAKKMWDSMTENDKVQAVMQNSAMIAEGFGAMFDSIMGTMDENSEQYRALLITQTILNTLGGIIGATASIWSPENVDMTYIGQAIAAATTSAAILASGIATISQMKSVNENSTLSPTTVSMSAVKATNNPIVQNPTLQGNSETDSKVYVLETDITKTQNSRKQRNANVRF